jgi:hypothetical protein
MDGTLFDSSATSLVVGGDQVARSKPEPGGVELLAMVETVR